jgi:predicted nucleic acid-binding Zn finger protein
MSKDLLNDLFNRAKEYGIINEELAKYLESIFPERTPDVLKIIKRGITKHIYKPSDRIVWIVIGENDEYFIYPKTFCSCTDFYKNVIIKRKRQFCKHLIAQIISEALGGFKVVEIEDKNFRESLKEVNLEI